MLSHDEMIKIAKDMMENREPKLKSEEAREFADMFRQDMELAARKGWIIELPFEISDVG